MALGQHKRAVGVFPTRAAVERALHELRNSGFDMNKVSVVVRDADKNEEIAGADVTKNVGNQADLGAAKGALAGGTLGGLTGLLVGLGILAIPGIGPVMLAGATATTIATTLSGTAIGAATGGLLGALIGLGIPEERARVYNERVTRGEYLVIVDGTDEEIRYIDTFLNRYGIEEFGVYDRPEIDRSHTHYATSLTHEVTPEVNRSHSYSGIPLTDEVTPVVDRSHTRYATPVTHEVTPVVDRSHSYSGIPLTDEVTPSVDRSHTHYVTTPQTDRTADFEVVRNKTAVGYFSHRRDAEQAIDELRNAGFPMSQVSLFTKDLDRWDRYPSVEVRDRFDAMRLGFPEEGARYYYDRIDRGDYVVIVHGTSDQIQQAASILSDRRIQAWQIYDPMLIDSTATTYTTTTPIVETPGYTNHSHVEVISEHPQVTIVDRRDTTL